MIANQTRGNAMAERVNLRIPESLVKSARVVAALEGKSLAALVEEILGPELARREKSLLASRARAFEEGGLDSPAKGSGRRVRRSESGGKEGGA